MMGSIDGDKFGGGRGIRLGLARGDPKIQNQASLSRNTIRTSPHKKKALSLETEHRDKERKKTTNADFTIVP